MEYIVLLILFISIEFIYLKIAQRYNIKDKPNSRSSHAIVTLTGGGVLFPIAISIAFLLGFTSWKLTLAIVLIALVSFVNDIKPLSQQMRFASHFVAVGLVFYDLNLLSQVGWLLPIIFLLVIGLVNTFNFMDGINGMTVLYALISIVSFAILPINEASLPLLITMGLACFVFGLFNVRVKAKVFAGDVGSISIALFLVYFMVKTTAETGQLGFVLFFCIYGIDAIITITSRLLKKQNIFEAHRSHLYQYLANEQGYSHVLVALIYSGLQLVINIFIIYMHDIGCLSLSFVAIFLSLLTIVYLVVRGAVVSQLIAKQS